MKSSFGAVYSDLLRPGQGGGGGGSGGGSGGGGWAAGSEAPSDAPLVSTLPFGPLPVVGLARREVRAVACGSGFTIVLTATEWMADRDAPNCKLCDAPFAIGRRARHHCRNCGGIFCAPCSQHKVPLLKLGWIAAVRVCNSCFERLAHE